MAPAQREKAKAENREKIKAAAAEIIRREGMEKLTMRHLAEVAGVSLRTPYNLFGSKTDVLIALLDEASFGISDPLQDDGSQLVLEGLLAAVDRMGAFFDRDEIFYRDVFWGIMSSEPVDARRAGYERTIELVSDSVKKAIAAKELDAETDAKKLGEHLAILLMSVLGMWGAGYFSNAECCGHIRLAWSSAFLAHATRKPRSFLLKHCAGFATLTPR